MRTFFQITSLQNQEENLDPHELKVLFLGTPVKQDSVGQADIRDLSELEEPPESTDNQGVLTYTKKISYLRAGSFCHFLGFRT